MIISEERMAEVMRIMEISGDLRKASINDEELIFAAIHDILAHTPAGLAYSLEHLSELKDIIDKAIEEMVRKAVGQLSDISEIKERLNNNSSLVRDVSVGRVAKESISELIEFINEDEPDDYAKDFINLAIEVISNINDFYISTRILPMVQRGIYSTDISKLIGSMDRDFIDKRNDESFWQNKLEHNKKLLEHLLGGNISLCYREFGVGSTDISGKGNRRTDFALLHSLSRNINLVEIKTPGTALLSKRKYRGTFGLSNDLSGTIAQVLIQKSELVKNFYSKKYNGELDFEVFAPRCYIICGLLSDLNNEKDKLRAFEIHRDAVSSHVKIITFDELYSNFLDFNRSN
ncbi:Shedu immune nuclease family protein [Aeromonas dhakensis]|uniref:Shedu immune nuclease family protein n=1 Tax=Aeromonas dhakensis TaxID=196024 RepID=UPI003B9FDE81